MTIKNPHIIHMIKFDNTYTRTIKPRYNYMCNQACITTPQKSTENWNKVTCKNCLKRKK